LCIAAALAVAASASKSRSVRIIFLNVCGGRRAAGDEKLFGNKRHTRGCADDKTVFYYDVS
jgi:hypothetical protein